MAIAFDAYGGGPVASKAKAAGVYARGWYSSNDPNKDATKQLVDAYAAEGIYGWTNFETTTTRWQAGYAAGKADAQHAIGEYVPFGMPKGAVVILSYDMDVNPADYATAADYAKGAHDWLISEGYTAGAYAQDGLIVYLRERGLIEVGWRSMSGSFPGNPSTTDCQIVQTGGGSIDGISIDWDTVTPGFGEWLPGKLAGAPAPPPTVPEDDVAFLMQVSGSNGAQWLVFESGTCVGLPDAFDISPLASKFGSAVELDQAMVTAILAAQPPTVAQIEAAITAAVAGVPAANVGATVTEAVTDVLSDLGSALEKGAGQ